ncbi:hypothetical protein [Sorangium sp. So ce1151]|uniref:hypothetical protein n=1 Tax=Sorangium sp. So ce1151 TaxID=3133332 RepID=UPI003F60C3FC
MSDHDSERQPEGLDDQEKGSSVHHIVSFDEMNLVELPFALLMRRTNGIYEIPLSSDGKSRLACLNSSEYGLPNSLAPRVVLGLMWMWRNECKNNGQSFSVKVRELAVRYMFPDRFKSYPPGSELLRAIERQINCIANSRIHTDRWWDKALKRHLKANVAIISDVKVLDEGGRHGPRVLRVTWGAEFFESLVRRYTKPLDAGLVQRLENPLDLQLYRLLDRQLAIKPDQYYSNIVDLARFKLGMRAKKIDIGGRTACSYVAQKLKEAIKRLSHEQFTVRMTIDRTIVPFTVTFERFANPQPEQAHEVHDRDLVAELVREFLFCSHGVPREQERVRITQSDRTAAKEWLDAYGFEKAKWMVQHCLKLQKERGAPGILVFRGLQLYEGAASGAYERHVAAGASRTEQRFLEQLDAHWGTYRKKLVELFDASTSAEERAALEAEARASLAQERPDAPAFLLDALLRGRLGDLKAARMSALSEGEFRAHRSLRELRDVLAHRHALDLLGSSGEGAEGEGSLPSVA